MSSEENLVASAYREHGDRIYRFFLRRTGDHHTAEDLAQRVFADAAEALGRTRPDSVLGWLYAVAERRFCDELRRRQRAATAAAEIQVPLDTVYDSTTAHAVKRAVEQLDGASQRVVVMRLLEDRSYAEIAASLGMSESAAKMRLSRALKTMRTYLAREGIAP